MDPNSRHSVFILCGDTVKSDLGGNVTRNTLWQSAPKEIRTDLSEDCGSALRRQRPVHGEGTYLAGEDTECRYRYAFMPGRSEHDVDPEYAFGAFTSIRLDG